MKAENVMKEEVAVVPSPLLNIKAAFIENGIIHTKMLFHVKRYIQWHVFFRKQICASET